jgi:hypothetical protein
VPMPIWVRTWGTAIPATETLVMAVRAGSQTRCEPASTAWLNAAGAAVVIAIPEAVVMEVDRARVAAVAAVTGLVGQAVLAALTGADQDARTRRFVRSPG